MNTYRSKQTIDAVQFTGSAIPGVTCDGSSEDPQVRDAARHAAGCDKSRAHLLHVHTMAPGGLTVLKDGDWIFPLAGGPYGVVADEVFRNSWEVAEPPVARAAAPPPLPPPLQPPAPRPAATATQPKK